MTLHDDDPNGRRSIGSGPGRTPAPAASGTVASHDPWRSAVPRESDLELAQRQLGQSRSRRSLFAPVELRGSEWNVLLDLYCARLASAKVSVSAACIAADVPVSTALRSIRRLVASGIVNRFPDPQDRRRHWLEIADEAALTLTAWLRSNDPDPGRVFSSAAASDGGPALARRNPSR